MKCYYDGQDLSPSEIVVDHIAPRSSPRYNAEENIRYVCRRHMKRQPWYKRLWHKILAFLEAWSFMPCHKEWLGYRCHHRVYPNGTKECGSW
jgi:hypothetical protein